MLFTQLPLCDSLLEGLQAMNFKETTPIQEQAIPVILEKKDLIACAQTGTGKTAAFLLPMLNNLQTDGHEESKINAIIMAPTRELAQQIDQQMEGFSYFTPFSSVAVYGGNDGDAWNIQKKGLLSGADVVIATPGRLLSHINLYNIDFSGVKYFILDEADRMLDMGFHEDIMKIAKLLPKDRQTIMFSATMPSKIQQLAKTILRNPVEISIAISRPPETILQSAYICHESQKINIVKHLFKEKAPNKVILFSGSKQKVKEIAKTLTQMGLSAGEMHSDLDQTQRNHIMHEFKNERVNILVATDIVSRGIDIDDISLVINFDVPYDAEDYVHRIGRTARAGDSGMAITFVSPEEQYRFNKIEQFIGKQIYRIPVPSELGDAPEYNPSQDNRRNHSSSSRSVKGNNGKKGKGNRKSNNDKPDKLENSSSLKETPDNLILSEESNASKKKEGQPEKNKREFKSNRPKKLKKSESTTEPQLSDNNPNTSAIEAKNQSKPKSSERLNRNPNSNKTSDTKKNNKTSVEQNNKEIVGEGGQQRAKIEQGKKKTRNQKNRNQQDKGLREENRNNTENSNQKRTKTLHKRVRPSDNQNVNSNRNIKGSSEQNNQQDEKTTKSKWWKWWPFGKK